MKGKPATVPAPAGKPAGPGLSKLTSNPKMLAAGVLGVVGLAVLSRRGGGASSDAEPAQTGQLNPSQGGYYDSTANDVYNSLMGQLEALGLAQSSSSSGPSTPTPAPTTTTPKPAPPKPGTPAVKTPPKRPAPPHRSTPVKLPKKKPTPIPRKPQLPTYMVRSGDSLSSIASRYGIKDWKSIYAANVSVIGKNPNLIKKGQVLRLPGIPEKKK